MRWLALPLFSGVAIPFALLVALSPAHAFSPPIVQAPRTFPVQAGETTSAVIPPGVNSYCPNGKILITNDFARPSDSASTSGVVWAEELDGTAPTPSTHGAIPNGFLPAQGTRFAAGALIPGHPQYDYYSFGSNDGDLVALPDGSLVYEIDAFTRRPLDPSPGWFDWTYRSTFGPGARTTLAIWKSEKCGADGFTFESEIDSAAPGHADCATPQNVLAPLSGQPDGTLPPASGHAFENPKLAYQNGTQLVYDMGGTDGPTLGLGERTGQLYAFTQCVGHNPAAVPQLDRAGMLALAAQPEGFKSYAFTSLDDGATWKQAADGSPVLPANWRTKAVATSNGTLALAIKDSVYFVSPSAGVVATATESDASAGWAADWANSSFVKTITYTPVHACPSGQTWDGTACVTTCPSGVTCPVWCPTVALGGAEDETSLPNGNCVPLSQAGFIALNVAESQAIARIPGSDRVLFLYTKELGSGTGASFAMGASYCNPKGCKQPEAMPVIAPANNAGGTIMHLTVVDPGEGPVLLYWYDVDPSVETATVMGRIIYGLDQYSPDFVIAPTYSIVPTLPNAAAPNSYFWGDYKSAGGFCQGAPLSASVGPQTAKFGVPPASNFVVQQSPSSGITRYFPVWIQPDGNVHFTEVDVAGPCKNKVIPTGPRPLEQPPKFELTPPRPVETRGTLTLTTPPIDRVHGDPDSFVGTLGESGACGANTDRDARHCAAQQTEYVAPHRKSPCDGCGEATDALNAATDKLARDSFVAGADPQVIQQDRARALALLAALNDCVQHCHRGSGNNGLGDVLGHLPVGIGIGIGGGGGGGRR